MGMKNSLLAVSLKRAGFKKGTKAGEVFVSWVMVHADLGRPPTVEEYAEWWKVSIATAYRDQARWREVWPEFSTPSDAAAAMGLDPAKDAVSLPVYLPAPST